MTAPAIAPHVVSCRPVNLLRLSLLTAWLCGFSGAATCRAEGQPAVDFGRDVLPILSENCFHCHGPDAAQRKADLRLDTRAGATADGTDAGAIIPGKSEESEVIRRVFSDEPSELMPPPNSNRVLTAAQKEILKKWVDSGAKYERHWAFVPPVRPEPPQPPAGAVIRNPIDAFITSRLSEAGLKQSPEADRARLLRRVTLDLTGLPPTLAELDAFLQDPSEQAYERAVERLLESPRYGERMVWEWLEAARYADTNGYQGDPTRAMWYWRDWAVKAFNSNQPYDQFTIEQLAGDLLPNPTHEQLIATGFHRNHMINGEGGRIAEESRVEYVQDRVETTGTVWLGLTLTCCRCHDHKYDPFSQKEYYQLSAYFNSIDESGANDAGGLANPIISFPTDEQQQRIAALKQQENEAQQQVAEIETQARNSQAAWEARLAGTGDSPGQVTWKTLEPVEMKTDQGTVLTRADDGSLKAGEASPATDDYTLICQPDAAAWTGLRLEALPDEAFTNKGPGRAPENGNFVLNELTVEINGQPVELSLVSADHSQGGWDAKGAVDGRLDTGWAVLPEFGKPHTLICDLRKVPAATGPQKVTVKLAFRFGGQHTLGRFRIALTADDPLLLRTVPEALRPILAKPADQRTDAEKNELSKFYLETHPQVLAARQQRDAVRKEREGVERQAPRTMVLRDRAQPRETFILTKGAYNAYGEKVEHGVLRSLAPLPADAPPNRLALAQWLVSPEHPLMARVTVNRFWQQFFGTGLVKTAEDFGVQGDKPSHPELLDWLAVEFRESGWNVKHLVKLIVNSATYRQTSQVSPELVEADPENRLLARGPRYRWPSWMLRDQALAISGLLVEQAGGPPVKGYQPPGIWEEATFGQIRYQPDTGDALYRRSLYTFWRRIVAPTMFFDVANRQNCTVKTARTNTPLQALITLNDITFVEAARALAQRTLLDGSLQDDTARLTQMFRRCTARDPQPRELEILQNRLAKLQSYFADHAEDAHKLLAVGASKPDASLKPNELAAWTSLANLLLNLDETLTKE